MIVLAPDLAHLSPEQLHAELDRLRVEPMDADDRETLIANVLDHLAPSQRPGAGEVTTGLAPDDLRWLDDLVERSTRQVLTRRRR